MRVALYAPNGAYAGYSLPQGIGNYANVQVANPQAGTWTAVFADAQNNSAQQGTIDSKPTRWKYGNRWDDHAGVRADQAGQDPVREVQGHAPATAGDTSQSIVVNSGSGNVNTIPVTMRTLAPTAQTFNGVLTGGNGRGNPAETSTYAFKVPTARRSGHRGHGGLRRHQRRRRGVPPGSVRQQRCPVVEPVHGQHALQHGDRLQGSPGGRHVDARPRLAPAGLGCASQHAVRRRGDFNKVTPTSDLPERSDHPQGSATDYTVTYTNTSPAPQLIFLDPRQSTSSWLDLANLDGSSTVTVATGAPGIYTVPQDTTKLQASLSGSAPVTFNFDPWSRVIRTCTRRVE